MSVAEEWLQERAAVVYDWCHECIEEMRHNLYRVGAVGVEVWEMDAGAVVALNAQQHDKTSLDLLEQMRSIDLHVERTMELYRQYYDIFDRHDGLL